MWDKRYEGNEFKYGKIPIAFLVQEVDSLPPGKALCLGAGEGRNAVWLAEQGFNTSALDNSAVGLEKARQLAVERKVEIEIIKADITTWVPGERRWDLITLFYLHLRPEERAIVHEQAVKALAPGGRILLQGFSPRQLGRGTGGPGGPVSSTISASEQRFIDPEELPLQFAGLEVLKLEEMEIPLVGGILHRGSGVVVRYIGRKA